MWRHRFNLVVLDDQLQHHKKKLNALKHLTSGRKIVQFIDFWANEPRCYFRSTTNAKLRVRTGNHWPFARNGTPHNKRFISFEDSSKHLLSMEKLASQPTRDASPHFYGSFWTLKLVIVWFGSSWMRWALNLAWSGSHIRSRRRPLTHHKSPISWRIWMIWVAF